MISVGDRTSISKTFGEVDVTLFAAVSLDTNPAHLDERYAAGTPFGKRIAHGMLTAGLVSACLGTKLPGPGTIYLSQHLRFARPVFLGDTVTAEVEVIAVEDKGRVRLMTTCRNQDGDVVVEGEALVIAPREEAPS